MRTPCVLIVGIFERADLLCSVLIAPEDVSDMPGNPPAVSDAKPAQADSGNRGDNLHVPTPESPLWYPQVSRSGQQGLGSALPKFGLSSGTSQSGAADAGLYNTETLPSLEQFELPLLKTQQVVKLLALSISKS